MLAGRIASDKADPPAGRVRLDPAAHQIGCSEREGSDATWNYLEPPARKATKWLS